MSFESARALSELHINITRALQTHHASEAIPLLEALHSQVEQYKTGALEIGPHELRILSDQYLGLYSYLISIDALGVQSNENLYLSFENPVEEFLTAYPFLIQTVLRSLTGSSPIEVRIEDESSIIFDLGEFTFSSMDGTIRDSANNILVTLRHTSRKFFFLLCKRGFDRYSPEVFTSHKEKSISTESMSTYISRLRKDLQPLAGKIQIVSSYGNGYFLLINHTSR